MSRELAASGEHDYSVLHDATTYLQGQWESLQHMITRSSQRAQVAMDSAWKYLTGKS